MAVILQPAGSPEASEHYNDTIENPVKLTDSTVRMLLGSDLSKLEQIFDGDDVPMWGIVPSKINTGKYNRMHSGDRVLFARKNRIYASGTVAYMFENHDLSVNQWEVDDQGRAWSLMYALSDIKAENISYLEFNRAVGYADTNIIQGFNVLDSDKSACVEAAFFSGKAHIQPQVSGKEYGRLILDEVDAESTVKRRREQAYLRNHLFRGKATGVCSICGRSFPVQLLVAAHIKPRSRCTKEELLDLNVVMSACALGCDALYERGWIGVDVGGVVRRGDGVSTATSAVSKYVDGVEGRGCTAHNPSSAGYFEWHWGAKVRTEGD
jgi:hypothetical protein